MASEADSYNGLISSTISSTLSGSKLKGGINKRRKKRVPHYDSMTSKSTDFKESNKSPYNSQHQNESLRDTHYDYLWKFICVGDCNVGKSSVLNLYKNVYYNPEDSSPTPGLGLVETRVNFHRYRIHIQLWDTSGDPRFSCLTASLYRDSMAFLLMFDVTNEESFKSVKVWVDHIRTHAAKNDPIIYLIGNKTDLAGHRIITEEQGQQLSDELELEKYLECCVFDGGGAPDRSRVVHLFADILNEMIQCIDREIDAQTKNIINHKTFRAKFKNSKFNYRDKEKDGVELCGESCCSCSCLSLFS